MITADELLTGAKDVGLRVTSLFQLKVGDEEQWQATLRPQDGIGQQIFGRGVTPVAALTAAYKVAGFNVEDDGT